MIRALLVVVFAGACVALTLAMPFSELGLLNPPVSNAEGDGANIPPVTSALLKYYGKNQERLLDSLSGLRNMVVSMPTLLPATTYTREVTVKPAKKPEVTAVEEVTVEDEVATDKEGTPVAEITTVDDVVVAEETPGVPAETKTGFNTNFPFYSYSLFMALAMVASAIAIIAIGSIDREEKTVLPAKK